MKAELLASAIREAFASPSLGLPSVVSVMSSNSASRQPA